jgi:hypothetical protein
MYSTLQQFKEYLWIDTSDTSQDSLLTQILNSSEIKLNTICGVDSFLKAQYTQTIESRGIYETSRWLEFFLKNKPVVSIDAMNWTTYQWERWTDYLIIYDRRAIFKKLTLNDWWNIVVTYTAWYESIPDDIKLMQMMLWSGMYQSHWNEWVQSYRLWDETITFWTKSWNWTTTSPDDQYFSFSALLNKYKNFILPL